MKNFNQRFLLLLTLFITFSLSAFSQQSDYKIKSNFETSKTEVENAINNAVKVSEVDSLISVIDNLATQFSDNEELLNHALYPDSFKSVIAKLKSEARSTEHKLLIIETQSEKIAKLSSDIGAFRQELSYFNNLTDSLKNAITASQQNEKRLSGLVTSYRQNLEQRDELIFSMVDSLFITYSKMNASTVESLSEQNRSLTADNSPLGLIDAILNENIQLLNATNSNLGIEDYLRIYALHNKVEETWNKVGDDLIKIYGGNQQAKWKVTIEDKLDVWKSNASNAMWTSLTDYVKMQNVYLPAFDNNESFFTALDSFISDATSKSEDEVLGTKSYQEFKDFRDFWAGKMKKDWGSYIVDAEVLNMTQIATIDSKLEVWGSESKPVSSNIFIILGLCAVAVIGFIVALMKR